MRQFHICGKFIAVGFWVIVFLAAGASQGRAQDDLPGFPSNSGNTGLFDMPSARLMPDWQVRVHYSRTAPYSTYAVGVTFLPWLEVNGRLTEISGAPSGLSADYGDNKDKALDFKIRLWPETAVRPAVAIGATDIHGTALFASRYLVASKLLGPLDVTLGVGQGILAGERTSGAGSAGSAADDAGFDFLVSDPDRPTSWFGGAEFWLTRDLSLLAEYSSLDYELLSNVGEEADWPVNFGLKYRWGKSILTASYQRGQEFSGAFTMQFPLGPEGMLPWKKQPFWTADAALQKMAAAASNEELALIVRNEVAAERFSNVRAAVSDAAVWVEIENPTYQSNIKAMGRALRAVSSIVPRRIEWIYLNLKIKDLIQLSVKMGRQDFEAFVDGRLDGATLLEFSEITNEGNECRQAFLASAPGASPLTGRYGTKAYSFGLKPSWQTLINDPSGFLKHRVSLVWKAAYYPWAGGIVKGMIRTPIFNNISSSNEVLEADPVRTDFIEFIQQTDVRLESLAFDQVFDLPGRWLARAEVGLFESAYGGVGAELFRLSGDGRWGIGLEAEWARKRDVEDDFKFQDATNYQTAYVNLYYKLWPALGVDVGLKLGRFLAGDWGGRLDVSRTFRHFSIGAWYTVTDTDVFAAPYNQGYHDKGVYLSIPFSIFKDSDVPGQLFYSIRPWTRDPGQTVAQVNSLYPMARLGDKEDFKQRVEELKQ